MPHESGLLVYARQISVARAVKELVTPAKKTLNSYPATFANSWYSHLSPLRHNDLGRSLII